MSVAAPIVCGENCREFRHSEHSRKLRALQFFALDYTAIWALGCCQEAEKRSGQVFV